MHKSWKVNRGRMTGILILTFYLLCCVMVLQDPALRQLGTGAKFGVVALTTTFAVSLAIATVLEENPEPKDEE